MQCVEPLFHRKLLLDGGLCFLNDRAPHSDRRFLSEVPDLRTPSQDDVSRVRRILPGQDFEERRLAGSVTTNQRHLLSVFESEGDAIQDRIDPKRLCNVGDRKEHGISIMAWPLLCNREHADVEDIAVHLDLGNGVV